MLEVIDVCAVVAQHQILDRLSLSAGEREIVAVLGPSGCGKTTLLRVIAGLQPTTGGRVEVGDRDVTALPPHLREVGLMFQHFALFPHLDVGRNVEFGLRMRRMPRAERADRVGEVLALVGLPGLERRPIDGLSGGEQQRVALARALAPKPRVLMLDEPLGALDRTLRDRLLLDLQSLFARLGTTVVYVTHDQSEALAVADRVAVMRDGGVVQVGTPREVWEEPVNAFVAAFLGFANVFPVDVERETATTPWGLRVPVLGARQGPTALLIPPSAVHLEGDGTGAAGVVIGHAFQGDRTVLRVRLAGGAELELSTTGEPPPIGAQVSVGIDTARTRLIDADGE
jgi:thiamine transport system ATP-binding protein